MNLFDNQIKKFIKDLQVGQQVDAYFKLLAVEKRPKKDGTCFLAIELMDKTGKIPARIWDNAESYLKILKPGTVYRLKGLVNEYMNKKEIKVDNIKTISPSDKDFDPADFIEKCNIDIASLFGQLIETVKLNLSKPYLLQLVDGFCQAYGEKFKNHYGAQKIHHAYLGGLLEHTYSMVKLAISIAGHYSLDKELLVIGTLFHDIGKINEFYITPVPQATMEGGLIGHIVLGNTMFLELKNKIPGFPEELSCKIQHLIISHHGEKEFGSPEVPMIPEAFALHAIDLLDSRIKIMSDAVKNSETGGLFTEYINTLGRRLYIEKGENCDK
ncbi:MAG TPA: HD domain-containing protein [Candidatus Deferrimicrobium sp.]|nr:HD domain-containing protein [Candidatus Deferrimicrobium sp.]